MRRKQLPFRIYKKRHRENKRFSKISHQSWSNRADIFKMFRPKRDTESSSDSYSEYESDTLSEHSVLLVRLISLHTSTSFHLNNAMSNFFFCLSAGSED